MKDSIMMEQKYCVDNKKIVYAVSIFFSFILLVYAPLELYLTNIDEFWFALSDFIFIPILLGIFAFVVVSFVGVKLRGWIQEKYTAGVFGFSLAMYIQSNFLNLDVGVLNGGKIQWETYRINFLINISFWIICIGIFMWLVNEKRVKLKKCIAYISLGITLVQCVTLGVLILTTPGIAPKGNEMMYVSNKDIYSVSEDENIIVFLLDMYDDRYFKELLQMDPSLKDKFTGFTQFTNSTGNYSTTNYSMATLLTGGYLYNTEKLFSEEVNKLYERTETFNILLDNNYKLDIYTEDDKIPEKLSLQSNNYISGEKVIGDYYEFTKKLYRLVFCRYMPNIIKPYVWMVGTEFNSLYQMTGEAGAHNEDNIDFYNGLMKNGISLEYGKKDFKFIHLNGTHYPYTTNSNIEYVKDGNASALECAEGVMKIVLTYMDKLKEIGVYDKSSIIITADHGYYWDGVLTNPVLLVKPQNETGSMRVSNAPVSQHDFHPSILGLAGLNKDKEYGETYFDIHEGEIRDRFFYQYYLGEGKVGGGKRRLIEYKIDSRGNDRKYFHLTGVEYTVDGEKINHFEKCHICQAGEAESNDPEERIVHE